MGRKQNSGRLNGTVREIAAGFQISKSTFLCTRSWGSHRLFQSIGLSGHLLQNPAHNGYTIQMVEGRKEGKEEVVEGGRKEGRKEGWKEGRKEGRKEGSKDTIS